MSTNRIGLAFTIITIAVYKYVELDNFPDHFSEMAAHYKAPKITFGIGLIITCLMKAKDIYYNSHAYHWGLACCFFICVTGILSVTNRLDIYLFVSIVAFVMCFIYNISKYGYKLKQVMLFMVLIFANITLTIMCAHTIFVCYHFRKDLLPELSCRRMNNILSDGKMFQNYLYLTYISSFVQWILLCLLFNMLA